MQLGVTFPQMEIGTDPGGVRAFAQAAEDLGYDYLLAYDHVLGADVSVRPEWRPVRYGRRPHPSASLPPTLTHKDTFHEIFVLFGYLAGVTKRLGLVTGVLVLGQRQTALVAKQAAAVDVLSGGRLRLGIGAGWNDVEFEALGMDFHDRGARNEEQIRLLRLLWTQEVVTFHGRWHRVTAAGINPLPVQRPIPIWIGGGAEAVLRRAGHLADGVFLNVPLHERAAAIEQLRAYAREVGRDPSAIGVEGSVQLGGGRSLEQSVQAAHTAKAAGMTHMTVMTMKVGFRTPDDHIAAIRQFREALGRLTP